MAFKASQGLSEALRFISDSDDLRGQEFTFHRALRIPKQSDTSPLTTSLLGPASNAALRKIDILDEEEASRTHHRLKRRLHDRLTRLSHQAGRSTTEETLTVIRGYDVEQTFDLAHRFLRRTQTLFDALEQDPQASHNLSPFTLDKIQTLKLIRSLINTLGITDVDLEVIWSEATATSPLYSCAPVLKRHLRFQMPLRSVNSRIETRHILHQLGHVMVLYHRRDQPTHWRFLGDQTGFEASVALVEKWLSSSLDLRDYLKANGTPSDFDPMHTTHLDE
ncbi:MAG: hypothetical protein HOI66_21945, partial [Verrucomicrobia bacterium]|nr:hypothetical protein [Verrucomicrobiota bacterium]